MYHLISTGTLKLQLAKLVNRELASDLVEALEERKEKLLTEIAGKMYEFV